MPSSRRGRFLLVTTGANARFQPEMNLTTIRTHLRCGRGRLQSRPGRLGRSLT
jgi:hypothetical protein